MNHLERITLIVCSYCLDGDGGECHTPGCAFWMSSAPDVPFRDKAMDALAIARTDRIGR